MAVLTTSDIAGKAKTRPIQRLLKRALDVLASAAGLILLSPLMALVGMRVLIKMGRPVLFCQARPGLNEEPFVLYKFRTMSNARGPDGRLLSDGARLTPLGRFMRRWSIDELPQLWNVLRGDMSLVGPRPLLMEYLGRYTPEQARRHEVKPGITGWAQVKGRNALTWEAKFELDVWYVDHWSLWLDTRILVRTLVRVMRRQDVSQQGQETMAMFTGTMHVPGPGGPTDSCQ